MFSRAASSVSGSHPAPMESGRPGTTPALLDQSQYFWSDSSFVMPRSAMRGPALNKSMAALDMKNSCSPCSGE